MTAVRIAAVLACWPFVLIADWASANWQPMPLRVALLRARRPWLT